MVGFARKEMRSQLKYRFNCIIVKNNGGPSKWNLAPLTKYSG